MAAEMFGWYISNEAGLLDMALQAFGFTLEPGHHVEAAGSGGRPTEIWYVATPGLVQAKVTDSQGLAMMVGLIPWAQTRGLRASVAVSASEYPAIHVELDNPDLTVDAEEKRAAVRGADREDNPEWQFAQTLMRHVTDIG